MPLLEAGRVGEADPGNAGDVLLQAVEQVSNLGDVIGPAQGRQVADNPHYSDARGHVAIQAIDHRVGRLGHVAAHVLADLLAGVLADQCAQQPTEGTDQKGDEEGDLATHAV